MGQDWSPWDQDRRLGGHDWGLCCHCLGLVFKIRAFGSKTGGTGANIGGSGAKIKGSGAKIKGSGGHDLGL